MNTETTTTELIEARLSRLAITGLLEGRTKTVTIAHEAGVDDALLKRIATANRLKRDSDTIVVPVNSLELCSRGSGWARLGRGGAAQWGERVDGGYRVGAGRWTVGGNDGFSRKREDIWVVEHIMVGGKVWTIAN